MVAEIDQPKAELSPYAPRILNIKINPEKIRDVIGPGGKTINRIIDETGVKIDIDDDGTVFITAKDMESGNKAIEQVNNITKDPEPGEIYAGKVTRIMTFGAFVEILPGKEGLLHISKIAHEKIGKVEDVLKVGDEVMVKLLEIDGQGRLNLSRKDLIERDPNSKPEERSNSNNYKRNNGNSRSSNGDRRRPQQSKQKTYEKAETKTEVKAEKVEKVEEQPEVKEEKKKRRFFF